MQVNEEDRIATAEPSKSATGALWASLVVIVLLAAGGYYFWNSSDDDAAAERTEVPLPAPAPEQPLVTEANVPEPETPAPAPVPEPAPAPVTEQPKTEPLPELNSSDTYVHDKVVAVANGMAIDALLNNTDMLRQFVVFVDNLAQGHVVRKASPLHAPEQSFTVSDITNKTYLNPDSYHRYDIYADFLAGMDETQLVATYHRLQPLLEQAFAELGYPDATFNGRLEDAMQEMIAAPVIEQPIELFSISVNYQFVDPKLEALPDAQKLMIRMGPENSRKVKKVLRQLLEQIER